METEFELSKHIDTVCLPDERDPENSFLDEGCFAMGWGKDHPDGEYQVFLGKVQMPLIEFNECQRMFRENTRLGHKFKLHESYICAGGKEGIDTCKGDGGGPLVCPSPRDADRFIQAGITAWGIGCGEEGHPGAYSSIPNGLCFIKWATKCAHGDLYNDYYDLGSCQSFIDDEITKMERELRELDATIRPDGTFPFEQTERRVKVLKGGIDRAQKMQDSCDNGQSFPNPRLNNEKPIRRNLPTK